MKGQKSQAGVGGNPSRLSNAAPPVTRRADDSVTVLLPGNSPTPIGGYKVAYQIADELARHRHRVQILAMQGPQPFSKLLQTQIGRRSRSRREHWTAPWFEFHREVELNTLRSPRRPLLTGTGPVLLTAWQTAEYFVELGAPRPAFQLVYDFEHWMAADKATRARMSAALLAPSISRVAMSSAVVSMLTEIGSSYIANVSCGVDTGLFRPTVAIDRRADVIGIPLRKEGHKASCDAIEAMALLRETRSDVRIIGFGPGSSLTPPAWIENRGVVSDSELVGIYNECAIFVLPSLYEGWGLPAAEAMACGAAVVSTDNGGVSDFLEDGVNGVIVEAHKPIQIAAAVGRLLDERALRVEIAAAGYERIQRATWPASIDAIEALMWPDA